MGNIIHSDDFLALIQDRDVSLMEKYLLSKLWEIYKLKECFIFWDTKKIRFSYIKHLAKRQSRKKNNLKKEYPNIFHSFPNRVQYSPQLITFDYYTPHEKDEIFQIFEFLEKPRLKSELDKKIENFGNLSGTSFDYLKKLVSRFAQLSIDGKYWINLEMLYKGSDRLGFYIYPEDSKQIIFHIGRNRPEIIDILLRISKFGLSKLLFQHVFVDTGACSDATLRNVLKRLKKEGKIIKKSLINPDLQIFNYYHPRFITSQYHARQSGCWILQIEQYRVYNKSQQDRSQKILKAFDVFINNDESKWFFKDDARGLIANSFIDLSLTIKILNRKGKIIYNIFEDEKEIALVRNDIENQRFRFYKIEHPDGYLIFEKKRIENSNFSKWIQNQLKEKIKDEKILSEMGYGTSEIGADL